MTSSYSTIAFRSPTRFEDEDTRLERREAILFGAPLVLIVLAVSAMCCIILLKWKIRDRQRRFDNAPFDLTTRQHQTEGKQYCGIPLTSMLT